jgi:hypothetical protein
MKRYFIWPLVINKVVVNPRRKNSRKLKTHLELFVLSRILMVNFVRDVNNLCKNGILEIDILKLCDPEDAVILNVRAILL